MFEDGSTNIQFTVQDPETPASNLVVSASSSNPSLVPNQVQNLVIGGSGTNRTLTITPLANQFGNAIITIVASDPANAMSSVSFSLAVNSVNDTPTLDTIAPLTINEDAGPQTVAFSGVGTGAANEFDTLTVTAVSSNPALIPNPTVNYTSPNSSGTLTFSSLTNANGTNTITVTVNDGQTTNATISIAE